MAAGFGVQKPNVGGLGAGVRPMPEMAGQHYGLATAPELFRQQESMMPSSLGAPNVITQTGTELTRSNMGKTYGSEELKELQVEYDRQEGIRQKKLEKLAELRGMEDLNAGVRAPASQRVGSGAGKIVPIASGPLKRPDDILNAPFLQGLY